MKKKIGLIVLAIIVVLGIAGAIFYFTNNSMKTPKDQFWGNLKQVAKTVDSNNTGLDLKNMSFSQSGSFKMKMKLKDKELYGSEESKQVIDGISKSKAEFDLVKDGQSNKTKATINLKYNDLDFLKFDVLNANNKIGIKIDEIYSKYFSIENKDLKKLAEKFNMDSTNIPDKIELMDIYEFITISKDDSEHIIDVFTKVMDENIPEESYTVSSDVSTKIFDKDVKAHEYKLELSKEQTKNLFVKSLEAIKNDDKIMNLIITKSEMILKMLRSFEDITELTKADIIKELEDAIKDIDNEEFEALTITNYRAGDLSQIIITYGGQELYNIDISKNGNEVTINSVSEIEGNNSNISIVLNQKNKNESHTDIVVKIDNELANIEENMSYDLKLNDKVEIEDFTDDNSINLNDKTVEELEKVVQEMYINLMFVAPKKAKILGIDLSQLQ